MARDDHPLDTFERVLRRMFFLGAAVGWTLGYLLFAVFDVL